MRNVDADKAGHLVTACKAAKSKYGATVLVLQGGGALGSYQAGVHDIMAASGLHPDWVAGISIGAINCALIAGNPPEQRATALREFWFRITDRVNWSWAPPGDDMRGLLNKLSSFSSLTFGQPGFFVPRMPNPWWQPTGSNEAISYYDTEPLRKTLLELVDFDLLNDGPVRLSVGAVNVESGNFVYFDNQERRIGPEHIMASGALPPGFPPVSIEGEFYWDGGLVSNTPLRYVLESRPDLSTLIFQVDLFSSRGPRPRTLPEAEERRKDIQFSSRTRLNTNLFREIHRMRAGIGHLLDQLPAAARKDPAVQELERMRAGALVNIIQLVYQRRSYDADFKDYEFSRNTMLDHWKMGEHDMIRTLRHIEWLDPPDPRDGVKTHDIHYDAND
ncbi:MAG: patatin-like phospholipase family protein [Rhodospirillales bacterium]